jgi:hypothetical protein
MAGMPALRAKANISCPACFAGFYRAIASFAARATELRASGPCGLAEIDLKVASRDADVSVIAERFQGG